MNLKTLLFLLLLTTSFGMATAQTGQAWQHKVAPSLLDQTAAGESIPFMILLTRQADLSEAQHLDTKDEKATYVYHQLSETAVTSQHDLLTFLENQHARHESLFIINAIKSEGTQDLIRAIAERSDVSQIMANSSITFARPVEIPEDQVQPRSATIEWGIDTINANDVWDMGFRGKGVVVGGEDTGYDWAHPALIKQYRGYNAVTDSTDHNFNWHDAIHSVSPLSTDSVNPCGLDLKQPCDDFGHGTHTMGTMVGLDGEDNQVGVAPEAKWCACRNMEQGNGSPFTYLECFQWFLAPTDLNNEHPDPSLAPHVINNSWGCPSKEGCDSSNWVIMEMAINNLRTAGTVVVVSAGNSGSGCSSISVAAPIFEGSFTVGATAENDSIIGFSSRGPVTVDGSNRTKPNVSAPGVHIRSTIPGAAYTKFSGTSMAGPHVAGVVALMICANPALAGKVDLIENIIEQTAIPKTTDQNCGDIPGTEVPNNTYGYGRIDALAAVKAAIALIPVGTHEENISRHIHVYPNPVSDQLIFDLEGAHGIIAATLFDTQGRFVWQQQWTAEGHASFKTDLSALQTGIYFYHLRMNGKIEMGKVVKR